MTALSSRYIGAFSNRDCESAIIETGKLYPTYAPMRGIVNELYTSPHNTLVCAQILSLFV